MSILTLNLKTDYWEAIRDGRKPEEYRLVCPYWEKRLLDENRQPKRFDGICLALGYPKRDDASRRLQRPWRGWTIKQIQHEEFGPDPVRVFAIKVN